MKSRKKCNSELAYKILFEMGEELGEFNFKDSYTEDNKNIILVENREGVVFKHTILSEEV